MAKVFRIHSTGASNTDWFSSNEIGSGVIDEILAQDKKGTKQPTSIPSPFARMDLVRTAFEKVASAGEIDGDSDNHKLISDAFDIGQILFNYSKHQNKLEIVSWDVKEDLDELINSSSEKQRHLGETLQLFLEQDAQQYNFNKTDTIFILKYLGDVIGGTSPRTLFFASPSSHNIGVNIRFGQDTMLDDDLLPLYQREDNYVKYIYGLAKTQNFASNFSEFNKYLVENLKQIKSKRLELWHLIKNIDESYLDALGELTMPNNAGIFVSILNDLPLKQFKTDPINISRGSDFVIKATKQINGLVPLVLPQGTFAKQWKYTSDNWDKTTKVPEQIKDSIDNRTLPDQGDKYPFLTVSDFLSDTIIKLPYKIDSKKYFTAGSDISKQYLLPINEKFFDFFTVEDILKKDIIKVTPLLMEDSGVKVTISIPTKGGNIQYERKYYKSNNEKEKYSIIESAFTLALFPFVDNTDNNLPVDYTFVIGDVSKNKKIKLHTLNSIACTANTLSGLKRSDTSLIKTNTFLSKEGFDILLIKIGQANNIIIPLFDKADGSDIYSFGIDFGTTNSHISYKINDKEIRNFDINPSEEHIAFLWKHNKEEIDNDADDIIAIIDTAQSYISQETIPNLIGESLDYEFPFRSCLFENKKVDYTLKPNLFEKANIGFEFENKHVNDYLTSQTDLKWASFSNRTLEEENKKRIRLYIKELLRLCKNKVLLGHGKLSETKIYWSYPVSMQTHRLNTINNVWEEEFGLEFNINNTQNSLYKLPESLAPFYYASNNMGIAYLDRPTVSIDIGGGTSDVSVFKDGKPELITSFKFAGNAIFGDGFNGDIKLNGFVNEYLPKIKLLLEKENLHEEKKILKDLTANSTDLISFFFSLEKNNKIESIDFGKNLSENEDFKIIFILFYSAIIYHIAQILKAKNFGMPRNLLFSGTASKSLSILDTSSGLKFAEKLFKRIFEIVLDEKEDKSLNITIAPEPKEITAKGLLYKQNITETEIKSLKAILVGDANFDIKQPHLNDNKLTFDDIDKNDKLNNSIVDNLNEFYSLFSQLNDEFNFEEETGMSYKSFTLFKEINNEDIKDYILQGIEVEKDGVADTKSSIEETLFFYPIKGLLPKLAYKIYEENNK
jgi:hypothetical protein